MADKSRFTLGRHYKMSLRDKKGKAMDEVTAKAKAMFEWHYGFSPADDDMEDQETMDALVHFLDNHPDLMGEPLWFIWYDFLAYLD